MYTCFFCKKMFEIVLDWGILMAKKENQRIILTKRLLQEGLLRLLETKELDKISVTELCRESGINRATFYNHYSSPQDLLADLELRLTEELSNVINSPKFANDIPRQMEAVCTHYQENARSILTLARCHADSDLADIFYELNQRVRSQHIASIRSNSADDDSAHLISTFLYTGTYHMIREWLVKDIQKSPREVADLVLTIVSKEFQ